MNMSPVARLKKTWNKVNTDKFDILEVRRPQKSPEFPAKTGVGKLFESIVVCAPQHQMDPSSNFSNYRTALRGATQRSETAHSSQEKVGEGGFVSRCLTFKRQPDLVFLPTRS